MDIRTSLGTEDSTTFHIVALAVVHQLPLERPWYDNLSFLFIAAENAAACLYKIHCHLGQFPNMQPQSADRFDDEIKLLFFLLFCRLQQPDIFSPLQNRLCRIAQRHTGYLPVSFSHEMQILVHHRQPAVDGAHRQFSFLLHGVFPLLQGVFPQHFLRQKFFLKLLQNPAIFRNGFRFIAGLHFFLQKCFDCFLRKLDFFHFSHSL